MLGGCTGSPNSKNASTSGSENLFFGQIKAIDGSDITIVVGEQLPQLNEQQSGADGTASATPGNGEQPDKPLGGAPPSGDTFLGDGNAPNGNPPNGGMSKGDGNAPNGTPPFDGNAPGITGEEQTITVSDGTVITVQDGKDSKTGSLTDLKTGDIVTVVMKDGKVTGITVMQLGMPQGANGPGPQSSDAASSDSTADSTASAS